MAAANPPTFEDQPVEKLRADLEVFLTAALDAAQALSKQAGSRSLSLVITKIEEAEMWSLRLDENGKEVTL